MHHLGGYSTTVLPSTCCPRQLTMSFHITMHVGSAHSLSTLTDNKSIKHLWFSQPLPLAYTSLTCEAATALSSTLNMMTSSESDQSHSNDYLLQAPWPQMTDLGDCISLTAGTQPVLQVGSLVRHTVATWTGTEKVSHIHFSNASCVTE